MNASASAAAPFAAPRFVDNGDGTITVPALGLMFTKATLCKKEVTHAGAEKLCAECDAGGHSDWRMPTLQELFAIADHSQQDPAIDQEFFPDTKSDWYWTSTPTAWSSALAWCVDSDGGVVCSLHRGFNLAFVRAVRAVAAGQ
jgi:hypothetical protein